MKKRLCGSVLLGLLLVVAVFCLSGCEDEMTAESENAKALSYYEAGDYERAEEYYLRALELESDNKEIRNNYGMALIQLRRHEDAVAQFDMVLDAAATDNAGKRLNKFAYRGKGIAYLQALDFESALNCFNSALAVSVESGWDVDILYYKANTLECMGYRTSAIEVYGEVLKEDKKNVKALTSRANLYREEGDYDSAIADYNAALDISEGSYSSYIGLYTCYVAKEQPEKAAELLHEAALLEVKTNEDKYYLGQVHFYQGNYTSAQIEMANAVDHGYVEANYFLGEIALANGEYEAAIEYYEAYRSQVIAESPTVCNQEVVCYLALYDYENAQRMLNIGLSFEGSPVRQQLMRNQVALYEGQGELMKAYEALADYIVEYPDDQEATDEYRFLKKRLGLE